MFTVVDAPAKFADVDCHGKDFMDEIEQLVRITWICREVDHY